MAFGKPVHCYGFIGGNWCYLFHPLQASRVQDRLDLVRQNYYTLRLQLATATNFDLTSTLAAPDANCPNLSRYTDLIFGFKDDLTSANWTAAWRGFNTSDTGWHLPSKGRFSIDVAPTAALTVAQYVGGFRLLDDTTYLDAPDLPLQLNLRRNLITGNEPPAPSGNTANSYTGTVLAGEISVTIAVTGMTSSGLALPCFIGEPTSSIGAVCGTDTVTVSLGGSQDTNTLVGIYVAKRF